MNTLADYNNRVRRETFRWIGTTEVYTAGSSSPFATLYDIATGGNVTNGVYINTSTDQLNYTDSSGNAYAVSSNTLCNTLGYKPDDEK